MIGHDHYVTHRNGSKMLVGDDEIRKVFGASAQDIIAALDGDRKTERNEYMYDNKRYRPAVDVWLKENGHIS